MGHIKSNYHHRMIKNVYCEIKEDNESKESKKGESRKTKEKEIKSSNSGKIFDLRK